ncbi:MAG: DUF3047 domain-containing protein [Candidatus Omnitrophica bacterium]|nr:DUF3047 domain-containing protein [Candidatus Omnitrophota bacterium]
MVKHRRTVIFGGVFFALLISMSCLPASATRLPKWFLFEKKDSLKEWEEKMFKGKVFYSVIVTNIDGYLSAYSENSASGIFYKLRFEARRFPMASWKWKVVRFPEKKETADLSRGWVEKDYYAARFYVIFPKLAFNLTKALEYIWDENIPEGTIITSPYSKNIRLMVIESGKKNLGQWVFEERNIYDDFKKAFGREPNEVGAIAIMTDTDNTASTAEAYYDEIKVGYKNEGQ